MDFGDIEQPKGDVPDGKKSLSQRYGWRNLNEWKVEVSLAELVLMIEED